MAANPTQSDQMFGIIPPIALKLEVTCCGATQFALALSSSSSLERVVHVYSNQMCARSMVVYANQEAQLHFPTTSTYLWLGWSLYMRTDWGPKPIIVCSRNSYVLLQQQDRQFFNQLEPRPSDERCDGLCDRLVGVKGGTHGLWPASQEE